MMITAALQKELQNWLNVVDLEQYFDNFIEGGWNDLDLFINITIQDLKSIGFMK